MTIQKHVPTCQHEFGGGLCMHCLCPETQEDTDRAINAFDNYERIKNRWNDVLDKYVDKDEALFQAWQTHRKQP